MPTSAIAQIVQKLSPRLYIDFIRYLPAEICLNILGHLDPLSLISVARSCRAWYGLSLDRKLWERLYYLEGWKTVASEMLKWEEKINRDRPVPLEEGHISKRRAISSSRRAEGERDQVMLDVDRPWKSDLTMESLAEGTATSLFGSKELDTTTTLGFGPPPTSDDSPASAASSHKGKQRALSPAPSAPGGAKPRSSLQSASDNLPKPALWSWDSVSDKYRMNWKHLYSLRRKLESNWELGKYTNFQFPHPNHPNEAHGECIYTIQFNSEYLVSGSRDRTIRIWNLQTRRLVRMPLVGHRGSVLCLQFDSDPDEDLIVSGSSDSNVILWKFSTGQIIQRLHRAHREPVLNVKFDKNILVTCSKDKTIKIFNRRELRPGDLGYGVAPVQPVPIHLKRYGYDDLNQIPIKPPFTMIGSLEGHSAAVNAVQIHGREIVSASGDRNVKIWDWPDQNCIRTLVGHSKGIACVQYDGRRIVSGSSDNEVKVFDRRSSLEVASLRSHSNLVRTVQAGFGDLPYSADEDEKEAAKMDQRYLEAVQNGTLSINPPHQRRYGSSRRANAASDDDDDGTLRPENIRFTGAKLPPGGGGGQYGRIVSGSYDTTIIIWRRDKRGVWKAQHHLKQEEAAAAAAAAAGHPRTGVARRADPTTQPLTQAALGAMQQATQNELAVDTSVTEPATSSNHPQASAPSNTMHVDLPEVAGSVPAQHTPAHPQLAGLIDDLIAQGVHALQQALSTYPALLNMQSALQAAIDRHPSPFVRSQLRQAVSTALVRAQIAHARGGSRSAGAPSATATATASAETTALAAGGAATLVGVPGSSGGTFAGLPESSILLSPTSASAASETAPAAPFGSGSGAPLASASAATPAPQPTFAPHTMSLADIEDQHVLVPPPATAAAVVAGAPPAPVPAATAAAAAMDAAGPPPHHPHMHGGEGVNPARVFKLQFDARRIICCSQTAVIVGWDFCNGDPELEQAVRFFSTIE